MDVHGTKLARTLFTIAREWNGVPPNKGMELTGDQFGQLGWYLTKTLRLHREYHRLYPDGALVRRQGLLAAVMLFCTVSAMAFIGFGFLGIAWVGGIGALSLWFVYFRRRPTM